ncbi:hypothetical protein FNV43_RR07249 [Rhamnella rubrinervis]|uniref:Transmembrane protein n=1 Tax=Rhamnella rubrinervis TaxID=2594499 RepID=A0A8K0HEF5_9ROSA|nr:hypothetical protein FNV43_RR07249 [Rhamnella rubrinervis]
MISSASKKVSMVMMLAVAATILMANFVRRDENMNINGNYSEPNHHHHHLHRHLGHDYHQYYDPHGHHSKSNKSRRMEGGVPHLDEYHPNCPGFRCTFLLRIAPMAVPAFPSIFSLKNALEVVAKIRKIFPIYILTRECLGTCC